MLLFLNAVGLCLTRDLRGHTCSAAWRIVATSTSIAPLLLTNAAAPAAWVRARVERHHLGLQGINCSPISSRV
ncbi:MAG: hypothetical protein E6I91_12225 [Chloroflexi bacterium]|nr:MAG: hypothetical protein E6I91_12225 [Chloroflexota bacterium]